MPESFVLSIFSMTPLEKKISCQKMGENMMFWQTE
jgi:hypothetical protein